MERIKNIIIITFEIILVFAIALLVIIFVSTDSTEGNYSKAKTLIKSKNYAKAFEILKDIPHYKDSSELELYIYPESIYYANYDSDASTQIAFKQASSYIDSLENNAAIKKYSKNLLQLKKALEFRIEELDIKRQNDLVQAVISESAVRITKGDYLGASEKLNSVISPNGEPEKTELLSYINFLSVIKSNDKKAIANAIALLDPNYSGVLASGINSLVTTYVDLGKWGSLYNSSSGSRSQSLIERGVIRLGMKVKDVLPMLGTPTGDNHINNQYGDFEKLSYDKQVLYFENNILKGIRR